MSSTLGAVRENILAQGFCGLDDETCAQINYPLRLSPAICMVWAAVGTALASPIILWALVPFAALGAILPGHPFDVFYNYGLCHLLGTPALPRYGLRRRFACALATIMIITTAAWGFLRSCPRTGTKGLTCRSLGDDEAAGLEFGAARALFERLESRTGACAARLVGRTRNVGVSAPADGP